MNKPIIVSDTSFKVDILENKSPIVLDFWAEWCGPCKQMAPALDELAADENAPAMIAKMNIEDNPETPINYQIRGVPTLILFNNGQEIAKHTGAMTKTRITEWINAHLTSP